MFHSALRKLILKISLAVKSLKWRDFKPRSLFTFYKIIHAFLHIFNNRSMEHTYVGIRYQYGFEVKSN